MQLRQNRWEHVLTHFLSFCLRWTK